MKDKKFDCVEMKRRLQKSAEDKLSTLPEKEQLALLHKKFGNLIKSKAKGRT